MPLTPRSQGFVEWGKKKKKFLFPQLLEMPQFLLPSLIQNVKNWIWFWKIPSVQKRGRYWNQNYNFQMCLNYKRAEFCINYASKTKAPCFLCHQQLLHYLVKKNPLISMSQVTHTHWAKPKKMESDISSIISASFIVKKDLDNLIR